MKEVKIVGITGGTGSGKSTIVQKIAEIVKKPFIVLSQDSYYKSASFVNNNNITAYNFDHPDAFDNDLLIKHLKMLKKGKSIDVPIYDFTHHQRSDKSERIDSRPLVIVEGLMVLYNKELRDMLDLKLYVDAYDDIRFIRRLQRDIKDRGRTVDSVINQYLTFARPGHFNFIEPTKAYADLIIPEGGYNTKALDVLIPFVSALC